MRATFLAILLTPTRCRILFDMIRQLTSVRAVRLLFVLFIFLPAEAQQLSSSLSRSKHDLFSSVPSFASSESPLKPIEINWSLDFVALYGRKRIETRSTLAAAFSPTLQLGIQVKTVRRPDGTSFVKAYPVMDWVVFNKTVNAISTYSVTVGLTPDRFGSDSGPLIYAAVNRAKRLDQHRILSTFLGVTHSVGRKQVRPIGGVIVLSGRAGTHILFDGSTLRLVSDYRIGNVVFSTFCCRQRGAGISYSFY
jgi:hypothetical protein